MIYVLSSDNCPFGDWVGCFDINEDGTVVDGYIPKTGYLMAMRFNSLEEAEAARGAIVKKTPDRQISIEPASKELLEY